MQPIALRGQLFSRSDDTPARNTRAAISARCGMLLPQASPIPLIVRLGVVGVFVAITTCYLVVMVVIAAMEPNTRGLRLDEIAH